MSTAAIRSFWKVVLGFSLVRALIKLLTKNTSQKVLPSRSHTSGMGAKVVPLRRPAAVKKTVASPVSNAKLAARK